MKESTDDELYPQAAPVAPVSWPATAPTPARHRRHSEADADHAAAHRALKQMARERIRNTQQTVDEARQADQSPELQQQWQPEHPAQRAIAASAATAANITPGRSQPEPEWRPEELRLQHDAMKQQLHGASEQISAVRKDLSQAQARAAQTEATLRVVRASSAKETASLAVTMLIFD